MRSLLLLSIFFALSCLKAQDTTFTVEDFDVKINDANLSIFRDQVAVYSRTFNDPSVFTADLNNDGMSEVVVFDYELKNELECYSAYVFDCYDSFFMTDSIYSGLKEPYLLETEEMDSILLITGCPDFDSLYVPALGNVFSPLACWSFADSSLTLVNDQLYEVFIDENDKNIEFIKQFYSRNGTNCTVSEALKPVIAAVYANYIYAGEKALAEMALVQFYHCSNKARFREIINNIL